VLVDTSLAADTAAKSFVRPVSDAARSSDTASLVTGKALLDSAKTTETVVYQTAKSLSDTPRALDLAGKAVSKKLSDSAAVFEKAVNAVTRPLLDGARALDAITVIRGKNFFDVVGATDDFDGALSLEDDQEMVFSKSVSDSAFIISTFNRQIGYNRTYGDSAQVTDIVTNTSGKGHFDSVGVGSSGTLRSQGYCEASYFAEDYVGDSRNFS
jgi:hypothetical protein